MIIKTEHAAGEKKENTVPSENTASSGKTTSEDVNTTEIKKSPKWYQNSYRQYQLFFGAALIILLIKLIWMWYTLDNDELLSVDDINKENLGEYTIPNGYWKPTTIAGSGSDLLLPTELKFVSRDEWLAEPPLNDTEFSLPVPYVIISHTATKNCSDVKTCSFYVQSIQHYHQITRKWDDIGYNFLVGGDGYVYEGTGWKYVGAHSYGYNSKSIGIAFIGNFDQALPPAKQITAAKQLIQLGVDTGYIDRSYKLFAARQLLHTVSPGLELYKNIKTWPHWSIRP